MFQSPFKDPPYNTPIQTKTPETEYLSDFSININKLSGTNKPVVLYDNTRAIAANNKFALTNITTKLDNDLLFEGLESYTGDRQQLLTTPMGFLFKPTCKIFLRIMKLKLESEFPLLLMVQNILVFDNKKSRIDKK